MVKIVIVLKSGVFLAEKSQLNRGPELVRLHHPDVHLGELHHARHGAAQYPALVAGEVDARHHEPRLHRRLHHRDGL